MAYQLHPDYQRQGYAAEALRELIRYFFEETDTQMITANAVTQSAASQALLRKLGFVHEGTLRKSFFYPPVGVVDTEWFYLEKP